MLFKKLLHFHCYISFNGYADKLSFVLHHAYVHLFVFEISLANSESRKTALALRCFTDIF